MDEKYELAEHGVWQEPENGPTSMQVASEKGVPASREGECEGNGNDSNHASEVPEGSTDAISDEGNEDDLPALEPLSLSSWELSLQALMVNSLDVASIHEGRHI